MVQEHLLKDLTSHGYTSCIRINGVPILPPLITPERRLELQSYQKKAIDLERRLKCQRQLKFFIQQLDARNLQLQNNQFYANENPKLPSRTLEHALSFADDASQTPDLSQPGCPKLPLQDCKTPVPSTQKPSKSTQLTYNIFDVSQYSDSGVVLFDEYSKTEAQSTLDTTLLASVVELDLTDVDRARASSPPENLCNNNTLGVDKSPTKENIQKIHKDVSFTTDSSPTTENWSPPKPLMLRRNSYTLDSPSPVLLEHLKKQVEMEPSELVGLEKYLMQKRRSLDMECSSEMIDLDALVISEDSAKSKIWKSVESSDSRRSGIVTNTQEGRDFGSMKNIEQAVKGLAQRHFGALQTVRKTNEEDFVPCNSNLKKNNGLVVVNSQIGAPTRQVVKNLPKQQTTDILELLERHQKITEASAQLQSYKPNNSDDLTNYSNNESRTVITKSSPDHEQLNVQQIFNRQVPNQTSRDEESKSVSCDSSVDVRNDLNTSTPLLIDFESDCWDNDEFLPDFERNSSDREIKLDPLNVLASHVHQKQVSAELVGLNQNGTCNRELFPQRFDKRQRKLKEKWAAVVLTAAAKGFLVRRLKRTERVKNLIQTIHDALMCAMSLHKETSQNIRPCDVELHRRLIQQVSAACCEFYDIFFNMTTRQQMTLIALDRQKLLDKLKRVKSDSTLKVDSGKSTPKPRTPSFNVRQKKSLTPSFAA